MDKKEMGDKIMLLFKEHNYKVGGVLLPQIILKFYQDLSPPEKELFEPAVHDIESRNFITIKSVIGSEQYRLTQAGYDYIYNA